MQDKTIFELAVKKAKRNGFNFKDGGICWLQDKEPIIEGWEYLKHKKLVLVGVDSCAQTYMGLKDIIFSHDFAKALWGENEMGVIPESQYGETMDDIWKHHLCMMILEEDPIKYLSKFI